MKKLLLIFALAFLMPSQPTDAYQNFCYVPYVFENLESGRMSPQYAYKIWNVRENRFTSWIIYGQKVPDRLLCTIK